MEKQLKVLIWLCMAGLVISFLLTLLSTVRGNFVMAGVFGFILLILVAIYIVLKKNLRIVRIMGDTLGPFDDEEDE